MSTDWKLVQLESPYAGNVELNLAYARACMRDCLMRGEAPFASHLLYTQPGVLDDTILEQRRMGIEAGFAFRKHADKTVFYLDQGWSGGMESGWNNCSITHAIEYRAFLNRDWIDSSTQSYECLYTREYVDGYALENHNLTVYYNGTASTFTSGTLESCLHAAETYLDGHGVK